MNEIPFERSAIAPGDCYSNAWNLVTRNFWLYVGVGFVTILMITCIPLVNMFILGPMMGGFYYIVFRDMRDEPIEFGMLFKGFEKFVPLMVIGLIQSAPGVIFQIFRFTLDMGQILGNRGLRGLDQNNLQSGPEILAGGIGLAIIIAGIVFFLISIVWVIGFQFAIPLVVEHDMGVMDAIKLSFRAGFSNIGGLIVFYIFAALVGLLGLAAICLGYFVAVPVIYVAMAFAYRQVFPMIEQRFGSFTPPPPTAYGFGN